MAPEDFDKQFMDWLDKDVGKTVANFDEWRTKLKDLAAKAKSKNNDAVLKEGEEVRRLYPGLYLSRQPLRIHGRRGYRQG